MADGTNEWTRWTWWLTDLYTMGLPQVRNEARLVMIPIALVVWVPSFLSLAHLLKAYGVSDLAAALIGLFTTFPFAIFASRNIAMMICPDLIQEAEQEAIAEKNRMFPPQT